VWEPPGDVGSLRPPRRNGMGAEALDQLRVAGMDDSGVAEALVSQNRLARSQPLFLAIDREKREDGCQFLPTVRSLDGIQALRGPAEASSGSESQTEG